MIANAKLILAPLNLKQCRPNGSAFATLMSHAFSAFSSLNYSNVLTRGGLGPIWQICNQHFLAHVIIFWVQVLPTQFFPAELCMLQMATYNKFYKHPRYT